jgi:NAD(P)-dependent dehydrogenase (short-subunit alcohol dehydrogenase family)
MKILLIGASGKIGKAVSKQLANEHEVIAASRDGDIQVDYTQEASIRQMYEQVGRVDALVAVVGGDSVFKSYEELTAEDFEHGYRRKLMGQVVLIRSGTDFINDGGSFTLSSGFLSHYPNPYSIATGPFNAAVDSFVHSTAPLLPRSIRLNVVSPAPVVDPAQAGRGVVTAEQAAAAYVESITGDFSGRVIRAWGGLENDPLPAN